MPTLTVYPDADPESATVDGRVRHVGTNITWATVRGGAGTSSSDTTPGGANNSCGEVEAGTTTDRYTQMERGIFLFDTSSIPAGATISSQTLSLYGLSKTAGLGSTVDLDVVDSAPASNTALAAGDYDSLGTTVYGSVSYSSFSTTGYNDISLSGGVTKAGITKLGSQLSWDTDNTAPTWSSAAKTSMRCYYADQTGTTNDPKLTVVYASDITAAPAVVDNLVDLLAPSLSFTLAPAVVDNLVVLLAPNTIIDGMLTVVASVVDQLIDVLAPSLWLEAAFYLDEVTSYGWYVDAVDNYGLAVT